MMEKLMDLEKFDLNFLAEETFALTEALQQSRLEESGKEKISEESLDTYPETPGVIYKLEKSNSTFCIRGFSTENLCDEFERLEENDDPTLWQELRVESVEKLEGVEIQFFPTEKIEYAGMIVDNIFNRRFPIDEDALCNLSDPGFSWWYEESEQGFSIYFKSYGLDRADHFVRLGPLSDTLLAKKRLLQAEEFLRSYFPISEFSCDEQTFHISSAKKDHLSFEFFKNIFLRGENLSTEEQFPNTEAGKELFFYFKRIAASRSFWIGVQDKLEI